MTMKIARVFVAIALLLVCGQQAFAQTCDGKRYCREMASCVEARFYLETCGVTRLDGDGDGMPCENLCGDGGNRTNTTSRPPEIKPLQQLLNAPTQCGSKTRCNQMKDCDEANFYFSQCGVNSLDRDRDGVPCEAICR